MRHQFLTTLVMCTLLLSAAQRVSAQGVRIDSVSPAAARKGEVVIINGRGFGALNVIVTVGGVQAPVLSANGNQATFRIPEQAAFGVVQVTAANPGGQTGSIAFRVLEGILLAGAPNALVLDTVFDLPPVGVDESDVRDGIIMTRLDLFLSARATVGNLNAALQAVDGGIVTMLRLQPAITIAIPPPVDIGALLLLVNRLNGMTGISHASIGRVPNAKDLPPSPVGDDPFTNLSNLLPARFPQAWNVRRLATKGCEGRKVNVLVADYFSAVPADLLSFNDSVPGFSILGQLSATSEIHGYQVASTLAAKFDELDPTGANPFPECLTIKGIGIAGTTWFQTVARIQSNFPAGKFLMNFSIGYSDVLPCLPSCTDSDVYRLVDTPLERAYHAAEWKHLTQDRWSDFLVGIAAGNEHDKPGTQQYPGLGVAAYDSFMSLATLPDLLSFQQDATKWNPITLTLPQLVTSPADLAFFQQHLEDLGVAVAAPADDVLLAGSGTPGVIAGQVNESSSSDSGADVFAVGQQVPTLGGLVDGTSFAAPQITGLAAYLRLLSGGAHARSSAVADLSTMAASITRQSILKNTQPAGGINLIDAYAAALSIDADSLPTPSTAPVRLALLDLDDNDKFDEVDLITFLTTYFDDAGNPIEPRVANYGRRDLNGDGYVGGSKTARFDLDRIGSTQFGAASYSRVVQNIGGDVQFDENALTDAQILCYYAYSDLYTGDKDTRDDKLANKCTPITVTVAPPAASLQAGATQQFTATVHGTPNPAVTWTTTGGTITNTGLFTAGSTGGTFNVRAISVVDPNSFGDATVTIAGSSAGGLVLTYARADSSLPASFCPGTLEPPEGSDYFTKTPNRYNRTGLATPPPNVGRFVENRNPSSPITQKANCRPADGLPNTAEIAHTLTVSGSSATWQVYLSSTTRFGLPAGGEAFALVDIPADGSVNVVVGPSWIKPVATAGGQAFLSVRGIAGVYTCFYDSLPNQTVGTSCGGNAHFAVLRGEHLILDAGVTANAEGNGLAITVTYNPGSP